MGSESTFVLPPPVAILTSNLPSLLLNRSRLSSLRARNSRLRMLIAAGGPGSLHLHVGGLPQIVFQVQISQSTTCVSRSPAETAFRYARTKSLVKKRPKSL